MEASIRGYQSRVSVPLPASLTNTSSPSQFTSVVLVFPWQHCTD